ncbi:MAG TPA: SCP2 sterol-binding domain-containing protein [Streptosporangiaceae bacterium]
MATAEECRTALESLTARIADMSPEDRASRLADRTLSCRVTDLEITFWTRLGAHGAEPVREQTAGDPPAQIRFSAASADVVAVAGDPGGLARAWLSGRVKVDGNLLDLLRLRKLIF